MCPAERRCGGLSRFDDITIDLALKEFAPPAPALWVSGAEPASRLLYLTLPVGWGSAQHPSSRRQVVCLLSGRVQVEAGSGEIRKIGLGAIVRREDTAGAGHTTAVLGDEGARLAVVQLPDVV